LRGVGNFIPFVTSPHAKAGGSGGLKITN